MSKTKIGTHGVVIIHPTWLIASNFRFEEKTSEAAKRKAVLEWAVRKLQTALNDKSIKVYMSGSPDGFDNLSTFTKREGGKNNAKNA